MENLYKTLECASDAAHDELKQAYQKLALKFHPDKIQGANGPLSGEEQQVAKDKFIAIDKAWKILGNQETRNEYDARWKQRCIAQDWPIQDEIEIEDFDYEEDPERYVYSCRCGGQYVLTGVDVSFQMDYVSCAFCSLCIKVDYNDDFLQYINFQMAEKSCPSW